MALNESKCLLTLLFPTSRNSGICSAAQSRLEAHFEAVGSLALAPGDVGHWQRQGQRQRGRNSLLLLHALLEDLLQHCLHLVPLKLCGVPIAFWVCDVPANQQSQHSVISAAACRPAIGTGQGSRAGRSTCILGFLRVLVKDLFSH